MAKKYLRCVACWLLFVLSAPLGFADVIFTDTEVTRLIQILSELKELNRMLENSQNQSAGELEIYRQRLLEQERKLELSAQELEKRRNESEILRKLQEEANISLEKLKELLRQREEEQARIIQKIEIQRNVAVGSAVIVVICFIVSIVVKK